MEWLEVPPSSLPNYLVAQFNQRAYFLVVLSQDRTRYHGIFVSYQLLIRYCIGPQTLHFSLTALTGVFPAWLDTLYQAKNSRQAQALPIGLTLPPSLQNYPGLMEWPQSGDARTWQLPAMGSHVIKQSSPILFWPLQASLRASAGQEWGQALCGF